jgi:4-hydroxy-tetrahydrodipicolinate synthase
MSLFKGTGVALVTPFDTNQQVDYPSLESLVNHIISGGANFLVAMGTTSEAATLNSSEKAKVLECIIKTNAKRVPIVLGMGGNNTMALVEEIKSFNFDGVDAILSVAPYYNKPTQEGLKAHFSAVAEACPLPVILYNVPGRTASNISPSVVLDLAKKYRNVVAVKEASGNMAQIMEIVQHKPKDFLVLSGDDAITLPLVSVGVDGVISVVANVVPQLMSQMLNLANQQKYFEAQKIHYQMLDLTNALFAEGNPAGAKAALQKIGVIESDSLRLPLVPVSNALRSKINELISSL